MKPGIFQQIILHRYRYWVGYTLFILFGVVMLMWQLSSLGPGLADAEKVSALGSAHWQWQNWKEAGLHIVNLPFVLLQKGSISVFGLSVTSVRLPSVIIGLITGALFFALMRTMHRSHIALSASVLFVAGSWYVAIGRFGTALIMIPFIWTLMAYSLVRLIRHDEPALAWAALGGLTGALALYTPYGIYAILCALAIVAIHPEIRRRVGALNGQQVALALFVVVPLLIPLGWGLYKDVTQAWALSGLVSNIPSPIDFVKNIADTLLAFFLHAPAAPQLRLSDLPLLSVGVLALALAGLYRSLVDWRSMRTQFVLLSFIVLLVVLGLNPAGKDYAPLIVPTFMLIATGVTVLFREWYRLFPRNPYARSFGLMPIVVLLSFIVVYHFQRYFVAWANAPRTYQVYDDDLTLVRTQLVKNPNLNLAVAEDDAPLYKVLARKYPKMSVNDAGRQDGALLISPEVGTPTPVPDHSLTPITNDDRKDSLRFWLVQNK